MPRKDGTPTKAEEKVQRDLQRLYEWQRNIAASLDDSALLGRYTELKRICEDWPGEIDLAFRERWEMAWALYDELALRGLVSPIDGGRS